MELNEEEKRQLFQVDGDCQAKVLDELYTIKIPSAWDRNVKKTAVTGKAIRK